MGFVDGQELEPDAADRFQKTFAAKPLGHHI